MRLTTEKSDIDKDSIMKPKESSNMELSKNELQLKLMNFNHRKRVADYLLGRGLGEGSFAKVHFGLHTITGEEVAIKVMNKAKARKDSYVHRNLRREGRILQLTRHPNIVQVYDVLETDNNYYVVTELCSGGDLIDIVTERGCLPEHEVQSHVAQLVSAVYHLHSKGIVHRDLKVENMLLDNNGSLKLIDFGLSNTIPQSCIDKSVALATQCGSPAYAAPELLAKKKYGPKADVWSIGIITYALLVGKLPFTVEPFRIPKLCRKMMRGEMNPLPSHISSDCRLFIRQLLHPDPKSRPTAEHVAKLKWISKLYLKNMATTSSKVDTDIATYMAEKYSNGLADILNCVAKNRPGEALATYYLLLKRKRRTQENRNKTPMEKKRVNLSRSTMGSDGNLHHSKTDSENSRGKLEDETNNNTINDEKNNNVCNGKKSPQETDISPKTPKSSAIQNKIMSDGKLREGYLENKVRELRKKFNLGNKSRSSVDNAKPQQNNHDASKLNSDEKSEIVDKNKSPINGEIRITKNDASNKISHGMSMKKSSPISTPNNNKRKSPLPNYADVISKGEKKYQTPTVKPMPYFMSPMSSSSKTIARALEVLQHSNFASNLDEKTLKNGLNRSALPRRAATQVNRSSLQNNYVSRPLSTCEARPITYDSSNRQSIRLSPEKRMSTTPTTKSPNIENKSSYLTQRLMSPAVNNVNRNTYNKHYAINPENKVVLRNHETNHHATKFPLLNGSPSPTSGNYLRRISPKRFSAQAPSSPRHLHQDNDHNSIQKVVGKFQNLWNNEDVNNKAALKTSPIQRHEYLNGYKGKEIEFKYTTK